MSAEEDHHSAWRAALGEQVHIQGRWLFRLAFGFLRDEAAAEDVCQNAFLKAWEERDRIKSHQALGGWLVRTVTNASLQLLRRRRVEHRAMRREALIRGEHMTMPVRDGELRDALLQALERLPELTRTIVVLRIMCGLSGNEVKSLIGCSAAEISRHLHRGLGHLRGLLPEFELEAKG